MSNRINPKKLHLSKWTAVTPSHKEKHFLVIKVVFDDDRRVVECHLEAALTHRIQVIDWRELKDEQRWLPGWR